MARRRSRLRLRQIKAILEREREIHYSRLAWILDLSPTYTIMLCKMLAECYPGKIEYVDGYLRLKEGGEE